MDYILLIFNLVMLGTNVFMAHLLIKQSNINLELTNLLFEQGERSYD